MRIIVSNNIRVINPNNKIKDYAEKKLVIKNPNYFKNIRLGYSVWGIPKMLVYYEINGNELILPFGCLRDLFSMCSSKMFQNRCVLGDKIKYESKIKLYDFQEKACQAMIRAKNGIMVAPARKWENTNSIRGNSKVELQNTLDHTYFRFIKSKLCKS